MKNSLKKLRGLALHHRHGDHHKEHMDLRPLRQSDEISRASQDMEDMRDCYDSLLSAAAATANSAYEFSESLREMGACLLEKTALNDDEESGKVLLMLGKVQFELQKLVDSYRSHIFQTITIPSESLLNELRIVEEMKHQCDEKREIYEFIRTRLRDKGRGRSGKGENVSVEHLQAAHDEYDDEAALFVFRLKSLKQGQSRSLLTQAARHHAAQLCFFKKALKSLEAVEPHVKSVTEQQHIDYNFTGIEDYDGDNAADDNDDDDNDDDDDDTHDDGELSFDYRQNDQENIVTTSGNSMDVDMTDITFPSIAPVETSKENIEGSYRKSFSYRVEIRPGSQSAPLFADNKSTPADKLKQMRPSSTRKFNSYVLPTPLDAQNPNFTAPGSLVPHTLKTSLSGRPHNLWHSSPLDPKKYNKFVDDKLSGPTVINVHSVLRESNNNVISTQLPRPLADGLFASRPDPLGASDYKKIKRYAFSGPIGGKPWPAKQISVEQPQLFSGPLLQNSRGLSSSPPQVSPKLSPKASPSASPKFMSSPKISELHELPRPPANSTSKSSKPVSLVGHSAPLMPKANVLPNTGKSLVPKAASPLPTPSQVVTRSFSIPSSGLRAMALNVSKPLEAVRNAEITESDASPPLTPITLSDTQKLQSGPETVNQTVQIRDID
ncbi:hypothetical protein K2173_006917 [Erythroxylum novogranatense]|uniref:Hydroxyproline-rich glycoprotein family protein n=1 Tax=Erythroxylum novogranatense TaxID=1862640 RepID=A0AAV8SY40_9ROSI|nr:hypothetical protein K2173_006917 [Erythroxylum novogranatense]